MKHTTIPVSDITKLRLDSLKKRWHMATYEQVLAKALDPQDPGTRETDDSVPRPRDIPADVQKAVRDLRRIMRPLRGKSIATLKAEIMAQAMAEAG